MDSKRNGERLVQIFVDAETSDIYSGSCWYKKHNWEWWSRDNNNYVESWQSTCLFDKVLAYIRQNGSVSMQKVMETCNYRSRTGARKLIDKMINADFIEKTGEGNKTIYKIKE